jgi:prepilin-type N-terminal cleavage/methylation domain-containing protein
MMKTINRKGLTLIEVLVTLAILSIILTALYSTFFISQRAVAGVDESLLRLHEVRTALDIMRREIESAKSGIQIKDRDIYGRQASQITFTAFSSLMPGLSKISYYVEEKDGNLILFKKVTHPLAEEENTMEAEIVENIEEFSIQVRDKERWLGVWNRPEMPEELKITVTVPLRNKSITLFETVRPMIGSKI